jgi:hypothetical protein
MVEVGDRVAPTDGRAGAHREVTDGKHAGPDVGRGVDIPPVDPACHEPLQRHRQEREHIGEGKPHISFAPRRVRQALRRRLVTADSDIWLKIQR